MSKSISKMIERVMDNCRGPGLRQVRERLEEAARAAKKAESKSEEKAGREETPLQKWFFDAKTGSMRNLTREQMNGALARIEDMIRDEKVRSSEKGPSGLIVE